MLAEIGGGTQPEEGQQSSAKLLRMPPSIALDDVHFHYAPDSFELKAGPVSIGPGEHIAIVGKSGSGKTTLLHLFAGLLKPVSGTVMVNGSPLTEWEEDSWFEQVSYITQHPYIFLPAHSLIISPSAPDVRSPGMKSSRPQRKRDFQRLLPGWSRVWTLTSGKAAGDCREGKKQRLALARAFF
ncbi:ATP-binding cassette domain-containing protein [Paenibacillus rhizoplanae]